MPLPYSYLHLPSPKPGEPAGKDPERGSVAAVIEHNRTERLQARMDFWATQAARAKAAREENEARRLVEEEQRRKKAEEEAKAKEKAEEDGEKMEVDEEWEGF